MNHLLITQASREARAACARPSAQPELWYSSDPEERQAARYWCTTACPVLEQCLAETMAKEGNIATRERHGIRGGLDGRQRRRYFLTDIRPEPVEPRPRKPAKSGRPPAKCGSEAAYQRHLRLGEPVDEACKTAHREHRAAQRRARSAEPAAA
ncbi:WhiB family transcriptional regulator [Streptomyces abikoensis]|uniref:WhiB family transcriptional regulator n=1 Tax=Streptomyces abikoensis TaxID=97398 RepID=UPI0016718A82|nr:hypothetical protein GCM10010214_30980 [Streptomyces abikoensis]